MKSASKFRIKENRNAVDAANKLHLPKNFELLVLNALTKDLEANVEGAGYAIELKDSLLADINVARKAIRSRDPAKIATLSAASETQSNLAGRKCHCGGDAQAFFTQYQLGALLKKFPFKGIDTKGSAMAKFAKAEVTCKLFNSENYKALETLDNTGHKIYGNIIEEIRQDIESLIGAVPSQLRVEIGAKHGPGTSLGLLYEEGQSTSYYKWARLPYSVTPNAMPYAREAILNDPRWIGALNDWYRGRCGNYTAPIDMNDFWSRVLKPVSGSRVTTVPKTALTDRTIAIEPLINVYLQLGCDRFMRRRLKRRWGYDLARQDVNQNLAREGAKNGNYATIDLSAASDTISLRICEMLLPPAWYNLFLDLRSPVGTVGSEEITFEKISSMGNGFTFALESLLFAAIVRHVQRRLGVTNLITAVYGDDIIVPTAMATSVIDVLQLCGFSINMDKTFVAGPFRESCGSDWFLEHDVRPVFLTRPLKSVLDLFYLHNSFFLLERKLSWFWDMHFRHVRQLIRKYIPPRYNTVLGPPSDCLDAYLFSTKRIPGIGQQRWHWYVNVSAKVFNHETSFFFRKLMAPLKGHQACEDRWDWKKRLTSGNIFDVTRRDSVKYKYAKRVILDYHGTIE